MPNNPPLFSIIIQISSVPIHKFFLRFWQKSIKFTKFSVKIWLVYTKWTCYSINDNKDIMLLVGKDWSNAVRTIKHTIGSITAHNSVIYDIFDVQKKHWLPCTKGMVTNIVENRKCTRLKMVPAIVSGFRLHR